MISVQHSLRIVLLTLLLVLCAGTIALWVRSRSYHDCVYFSIKESGPILGLASSEGAVSLIVNRHRWNPQKIVFRIGEPPRTVRQWIPRDGGDWELCGFSLRRSNIPRYNTSIFTVPYWFVMLAIASGIVILWRKPRKSRGRGFPIEASCEQPVLPEVSGVKATEANGTLELKKRES